MLSTRFSCGLQDIGVGVSLRNLPLQTGNKYQTEYKNACWR